MPKCQRNLSAQNLFLFAQNNFFSFFFRFLSFFFSFCMLAFWSGRSDCKQYNAVKFEQPPKKWKKRKRFIQRIRERREKNLLILQ